MTKEEVLEEYNFSHSQIKLYKYDNISEVDGTKIPLSWYEIAKEANKKIKCKKVIELWNNVLPSELSRTISFLKEKLKNVDLVLIDKQFYLFYSIESNNEDMIYYLGGNPLDSVNNDELLKKISVSEKILSFYKDLHNGFFDYFSKSMGLLEMSNIKSLSDDEWDILNNLNDLKINLKSTYLFFSNGMGDYVASDLEKQINAIWFHDENADCLKETLPPEELKSTTMVTILIIRS